MTRDEIAIIFDRFLTKTLSQKPEILKFVLRHERKDLVLDNLVKEIRGLEFTVFPKRSTVERLIKDIAKAFAHNAINLKEQQLLSDIETKRRIQKADYIKDAESTFLKDMENEALRDEHRFFMPGTRDDK